MTNFPGYHEPTKDPIENLRRLVHVVILLNIVTIITVLYADYFVYQVEHFIHQLGG